MPGTKDETVEAPESKPVVETPEETIPVVTKSVKEVIGKSDTEDVTDDKSQDVERNTNDNASSETEESNKESKTTTEKRSADEEEDEDTEEKSPKKKARADSNDEKSSNEADETEEHSDSA